MAPNAEVAGSKPTELKGDLEIAYNEGEFLLFPTTKQAADALNDIKKQHPKTRMVLKDDDLYELTMEGVKVLRVDVDTQRVRVLPPVAE